VSDLGRLKAYRLDDRPQFSHPRLRLIEEREIGVTHYFPETFDEPTLRPTVAGARSDNREQNVDLEREKRAVRILAGSIVDLIHREEVDGCYFAADSRINQPILDQMDQGTREKIEKNIHANLSKLNPEELSARFSNEG
jgi:hypothetical protein